MRNRPQTTCGLVPLWTTCKELTSAGTPGAVLVDRALDQLLLSRLDAAHLFARVLKAHGERLAHCDATARRGQVTDEPMLRDRPPGTLRGPGVEVRKVALSPLDHLVDLGGHAISSRRFLVVMAQSRATLITRPLLLRRDRPHRPQSAPDAPAGRRRCRVSSLVHGSGWLAVAMEPPGGGPIAGRALQRRW